MLIGSDTSVKEAKTCNFLAQRVVGQVMTRELDVVLIHQGEDMRYLYVRLVTSTDSLCTRASAAHRKSNYRNG